MIATMSDAKSIFGKALELPGGEREAFLDEACAGDADVRAEVESLLRAQAEAGSFLESHESPTVVAPGDLLASEQPGTVIGPYKLLERIGEGGMGAVYVAQQTEPVKRLVAIKIIKPGMDTRQVIARFEAERQALALMDHPNIARVLDAGVAAGRPYFVMELVKGVPITRFCDERRLTLAERLELFVPVCQAVQHAHAKGIIHRDLKPSNVLVALYDERPVPKVIDFGVAKATGQKLTEQTLHTGFGAVVGTPEYMSPEQASFNQLDVDTRSDIYSLGVLMYELLTGSPPFTRGDLERTGMLEMLRVIREQEPARPSTKLSRVGSAHHPAARSTEVGTAHPTLASIAASRRTEPARLPGLVRGELDWIVMKALDKDRSRRYDTASGLALDIQRYLADEPVQACPPSAAYRLQKFVRRNRAAVGTALAVAAALLIGIGVATWQAVRATNAERAEANLLAAAQDNEKGAREAAAKEAAANQAAQDERNKAVEAAKALEAALARERMTSYMHRIALAQREWSANEVGRAKQLLEECPVEMRDWEWRYVRQLCSSEEVAFREHGSNVTALAYRPDGKQVASASGKEVRVWDPATGKQLFQIPGKGAAGVAYNKEGTRLAIAWSQSLTIHAAEGGKELLRIDAGIKPTERHPFPASLSSVAFSPDGKRIAAGGTLAKVGGPHGYSGGVVKVWNAETGDVVHTFDKLSTTACSVAFSPDGKLLAAGTFGAGGELPEPSEIFVWNAESGQRVQRFTGQPTVDPGEDSCSALCVEFSPDSTRLAVAHSDGLIRIWNMEMPGEPQALRGHKGWVGSIAFSKSGDLLASIGSDRIVRVFEVPSGNERTSFRGHTSAGHAVAFSPDGQRIASAAGPEVRVWSLANSQEARTILPAGGGVYDVAFSPDDSLLASAAISKIEFRDVASGAEQRPGRNIGPGAMGGYARVAFSPAGDAVATVGLYGVKLWNIKTGEEIRLFPDHKEIAQPPYTQTVALAFSPDGKRLATTGRNLLTIWETATGNILHKVPFHDEFLVIGSVAFSPDGKKIATATHPQIRISAEIRLWDAETGKELKRIPGGGRGIKFSPDGKHIASANAGSTAGVWEVESGNLIHSLSGHSGPVARLAFSPDGRRIATASEDETVKLWDAASGQEVLTLRGHDAPVTSVAFSPDGRYLASSAEGKPAQVKLWDAGPPPK